MTCLCLTRNRREWLPKAIQCFLNQTYEKKELLILADGQDVRDLVPKDERITLYHTDRAMQIGEKRNFGCSLATGEVIAHWDDDDFSAPERLADQVRRLCQSGKAVTGYRSMRFTDGERWWQYRGPVGSATGTSLCYLRSFWERNKFPCIQVQEDKHFVIQAHNQESLDDVSEDLGLMYATNHPGNTSPREVNHASCWTAL